jgi:hypothetical protein
VNFIFYFEVLKNFKDATEQKHGNNREEMDAASQQCTLSHLPHSVAVSGEEPIPSTTFPTSPSA